MEQMSSELKLGYLIIYVEDVPMTVEFYERAFGISRRFLHESGQYAELETGETALAFAGETFTPTADLFALNRLSAKAAGAEVALTTDDVPSAYERAIDAGATPVVAPTIKPWGQAVSYLRDCNGFLVEICSPMSL